MLFQSIGAHYTFGSALRHLLTIGGKHSAEQLKATLYQQYGGEAVLYHKGRAALAEAVRLATGGSGKVAVTALTCYSVPQAVWAAGCEVVYVDINEHDVQFGARELEKALKKDADITAVVVQNTLGIPADIAAIEEVAAKHRVVIIEDLAHSAGATYADGRTVGTVGDLTMLSFGRDKALDVVNGGALIIREPTYLPAPTPNEKPGFVSQFRDRIYPLLGWLSRSLYDIGLGKYILAGAYRLGLATRSADGPVRVSETMPAWQAKLTLERLEQLPARVEHRRAIADKITTAINQPTIKGAQADGASLVRVPFLVDNREELLLKLTAAGIHVSDIWYDVPVSPERYYHKAQFDEAVCPVATSVAARLMNLPTHENVTDRAIAAAARIINQEAA